MCMQLMFGTRGMQLRATLPFYFSKHFLRAPAGLADLGSPDLEELKGARARDLARSRLCRSRACSPALMRAQSKEESSGMLA